VCINAGSGYLLSNPPSPPFAKGGETVLIPLFGKEGIGEIFKMLSNSFSENYFGQE
jgi:hypothetical protein